MSKAYPFINTSPLDMKGEEWERVSGYPFYLVSNMGRVKSLARWVSQKMGSKKLFEGRVLKQCLNSDGYPIVLFCNNGRKKTMTVHRLVAIAFIENPENKREVNHKKGIKTDNRVTELEWATPKENSTHSWRIGLNRMTNEKKEKISNSKLGVSGNHGRLVLNIDTGIYYDTIKQAADSCKLKTSTLAARLSGQNNKPCSFIFA